MLIALQEVGLRFGNERQLFTALTHSFMGGATTAVTGPSGSGKSSLLGVLAGLIEPTEGSVDRSSVERIVWVLQNPNGVPSRTALDHVALPIVARGSTRRDADVSAGALLDRFGLSTRASSPLRELSGGEAQRIMLARAVAAEPDLLLIDEPTAQLDRTSSRAVHDVIAELSSGGAGVVVATHDPEVRDACDVVLDLGRA